MFTRVMAAVLAACLAGPAFAAGGQKETIVGVVRAAAADAEEAATVKAGETVYKITRDEKGRKVAAEAKGQNVEIVGTVEERDGVKWITVASCKIVEGPPARPSERTSRPLAGVKALRDVEYARVGDKRLLLDLYRPAEAKGPLPLVVWIHGGAWMAGSKENCPALGLVGHGYAVASINYRLSQEAIFPAQIEDCKAAIRFLRANAAKYSIDGGRIGVWGGSAGGHLVALLGTSGDVKELEGKVGGNPEASSRVQCVVDYNGPTDFMQFKGRPTWVKVDKADSPLARLVGGLLEQKKDLVAKASPITYVTRDDPPFLVVHGDQDNTVPINQSELLVAALKKAGVEVAFEVVQGGGHGFNAAQREHLGPIVTAFFDKHLKGAAARRVQAPDTRPAGP